MALAGTTLVFGLWWVYFMMPSGRILHRYRERGFVWGYGHIVLFGALVGVGTGLHVAAQVISQEAHVDATFALVSVAVPVLAFEVVLFSLYTFLVKEFDPFHVWLSDRCRRRPRPQRRRRTGRAVDRRFPPPRGRLAACDRGRLRDGRPPASGRRARAERRVTQEPPAADATGDSTHCGSLRGRAGRPPVLIS